MPTYEYYCQKCDKRFEVQQRITEPALTECIHCGGAVRKMISRVGIVFKGAGFHVNDYRKPEAKTESAGETKSATETAAAASKA